MPKIQFKNITPNKSSDSEDLRELVSELDILMPHFTSSMVFQRDIFDNSDEDHYTETLIKYLENQKGDSRFSFKPQATLPNKRSIDIGVHLKASSEHYIFCIEAKFLPPKDYVTGEYAAIKRFKKGQHGLSNRNPIKAKRLQESAIVAYSKSGTLEKHFKTVNKKILTLAQANQPDIYNLTWSTTELLKITEADSASKLQSIHLREDMTTFTLHHYWVSLKTI